MVLKDKCHIQNVELLGPRARTMCSYHFIEILEHFYMVGGFYHNVLPFAGFALVASSLICSALFLLSSFSLSLSRIYAQFHCDNKIYLCCSDPS